MRFISQRVHGILDYSVAGALIGAPWVLDFGATSTVAAVLSVAAGLGLTVYSLLTDYSAGLRRWIPWRTHLTLDAAAAVALLVAPFLFGFGGLAHAFYATVGLAVLAVVATSQIEASAPSEIAPEKAAS